MYIVRKHRFKLNRNEYDAFLSFAVEDKESVATPLFEALESRGLHIWYSGREFKLGVSIQDQVRVGLDKSHFGILLISPHYFKTNWTQKELGALWAKERDDHQIIIPVFHNISPEEVGNHDPHLAERWSVLTSKGLGKAADKIHEHIKQAGLPKTATSSRRPINLLLMILTCALILSTGVWWWFSPAEVADKTIEKAVNQRVEKLQYQVSLLWQELEDAPRYKPASRTMVNHQIEKFNAMKAHYRNYYEFNDGFSSIQFEKNVAPATGIDFGNWTATDDYGFTYPKSYLSLKESRQVFDLEVHYLNTQPVDFSVDQLEYRDTVMVVTVSYEQPLRLVSFHYELGRWTSFRKHTTHTLWGLKPTEHYHFLQRNGTWELFKID